MQAFTAKVATDGQTMPNRRERVIGAEPTAPHGSVFWCETFSAQPLKDFNANLRTKDCQSARAKAN